MKDIDVENRKFERKNVKKGYRKKTTNKDIEFYVFVFVFVM